VEKILDQILDGTNITYTVNNRLIVVHREGKSDLQEIFSVQQKSVSGKVSDVKGQPLPGVTVLIKGTTQGTVTDFDGNYSLKDIPGGATLQFSFVGMKSQEVSAEGKSIINITMAEDAIGIEEVVAVGYGTQKKLNLTGSVASIEGDELAKKPVTQTSMALQGMTAGVTVKQNSGEPGQDGGTIRIRGIGTIDDSNPLVLVDGISSDINMVDPNDIETISVLKDAASAAIYGSRAANGVSDNYQGGVSDKFSVSYNNYVGWQKPQICRILYRVTIIWL
jgi:TonB-dependent SusC/RagA subfamily outer membrane receptor